MTSSVPSLSAGTDRAPTLFEFLAGADEINIVCHNNPDPDCLASALALGRVADAAGIDDCHILYSGTISHQQNRAFVNLLEIDIQPFDPSTVVDRDDGSLLAFVDHAVPGVNNEVPEGTPVDVVIDHHPVEGVDAEFVDHREAVGATATILTEYVRRLDVHLDPVLATALLFAIRRETLGFLRRTTHAEYEAAGVLHSHADLDLLRALVSPSVSGPTIDAIADAIENRTVRRSVLISHVGRTSARAALPQAADYLATLEGVETTVVFGLVGNGIELSARSMDSRLHVGHVLRETFADVGSAGGHRDMAGGRIPLGLFADAAADDRLVGLVEELITDRLVAGLQLGDGNRGAGNDRPG